MERPRTHFVMICHSCFSSIFTSVDFLFTLEPNKIAVKTTKTPQVNANMNISSAISFVYISPFFKGIGMVILSKMYLAVGWLHQPMECNGLR
jgi:hypothetical protein